MIANHLGDGVNIDIRAPQQLLCFVDTDLVDMVSQRYTGSFFISVPVLPSKRNSPLCPGNI